jgi:hypothetical protein
VTYQVLYWFFILSLWAQVKHFLADYLLQTRYMLGKFKEKGWIAPLGLHALVHFLFTFTLSYIIIGEVYYPLFLATFDFTIHFAMDRIKASPNYLGKYTMLSKAEMRMLVESQSHPLSIYIRKRIKNQIDSNTKFWWALGLDQMVHHITDLIIVFLIINYWFNM